MAKLFRSLVIVTVVFFSMDLNDLGDWSLDDISASLGEAGNWSLPADNCANAVFETPAGMHSNSDGAYVSWDPSLANTLPSSGSAATYAQAASDGVELSESVHTLPSSGTAATYAQAASDGVELSESVQVVRPQIPKRLGKTRWGGHKDRKSCDSCFLDKKPCDLNSPCSRCVKLEQPCSKSAGIVPAMLMAIGSMGSVVSDVVNLPSVADTAVPIPVDNGYDRVAYLDHLSSGRSGVFFQYV